MSRSTLILDDSIRHYGQEWNGVVGEMVAIRQIPLLGYCVTAMQSYCLLFLWAESSGTNLTQGDWCDPRSSEVATPLGLKGTKEGK